MSWWAKLKDNLGSGDFAPAAPPSTRRSGKELTMDVIKCLTCNSSETEWTHGVYPDTGGALAHKHQMDYPHHDVRVGELTQLLRQIAEAPSPLIRKTDSDQH